MSDVSPTNSGHIGTSYTGGQCAPGSEHFQFVRHLPHECVFLVVGGDKLCGAEDFQDGMIFAFR
jgi:hypothetical protein